jgi:hypothetical protein
MTTNGRGARGQLSAGFRDSPPQEAALALGAREPEGTGGVTGLRTETGQRGRQAFRGSRCDTYARSAATFAPSHSSKVGPARMACRPGSSAPDS